MLPFAKMLAHRLSVALLCALLLCALPATAQMATEMAGELVSVTLANGEEISLQVFGRARPGEQKQRVLWIAPSFGIQERHRNMADALGQLDMEVWQIDLADALFLTHSAQTMRDISGDFVADLMVAVSEQGQAPLLIISSSYGAIPTVRGIHAWQKSQPQQAILIGAVFFSPALFSSVPELGNDPEFVAETVTINIPLHIFQAAKHSNRWHFPALLERLRKDAAVSSEIMDGVTSLFYREDTAPQTLAMLEAMPAKIQQVVPQLRQQTVPLTATGTAREVSAGSSGLNTQLKPYRGQVEATPFSLLDTNGERFEFRNEPGKVTLINFWATWCPPCVKEIPSLNRLKQQMQGKPFELISIDYAEDAQRIREFMDKVDVHFPVLLDPDGKLAGQWKVVAFPSTFVIGPDGKIHYGVNAGIHWDTPEVIELLDQLLQLPQPQP